MDRAAYEKQLAADQAEHLANVRRNLSQNQSWSPCLHDQCTECRGTWIKLDGSACIHLIACDCPKCSPFAFAAHEAHNRFFNPLNDPTPQDQIDHPSKPKPDRNT